MQGAAGGGEGEAGEHGGHAHEHRDDGQHHDVVTDLEERKLYIKMGKDMLLTSHTVKTSVKIQKRNRDYR